MKRGKLEIIINILNVARTPHVKTRISDKANVSYTTGQLILENLLQQGLITTIIVKKNIIPHYVLTDKGRDALKLATSFLAQIGEDAPHSPPNVSEYLRPSPFSLIRRNAGATETCPLR